MAQSEAAAAHAAEATAYYSRENTMTPRRQRMAPVALALAAVCAGRNAEALRLAAEVREDVGDRNGTSELWLLHEVGRVYTLLGEREKALAILRTLMTGPNSLVIFGTPRLIRLDPCWSKLADDPRFDEILKAAKPL